jgi:hypothetical protein
MKITTDALQKAASLAAEIEWLEAEKDNAKDANHAFVSCQSFATVGSHK